MELGAYRNPISSAPPGVSPIRFHVAPVLGTALLFAGCATAPRSNKRQKWDKLPGDQ